MRRIFCLRLPYPRLPAHDNIGLSANISLYSNEQRRDICVAAPYSLNLSA